MMRTLVYGINHPTAQDHAQRGGAVCLGAARDAAAAATREHTRRSQLETGVSSAVAKGGRWWTSLIKKLSHASARVCCARASPHQISLPNPAFDPSYRRIRAVPSAITRPRKGLPTPPAQGGTLWSARRRRWDRAGGCRWERPTPPGRAHAGPLSRAWDGRRSAFSGASSGRTPSSSLVLFVPVAGLVPGVGSPNHGDPEPARFIFASEMLIARFRPLGSRWYHQFSCSNTGVHSRPRARPGRRRRWCRPWVPPWVPSADASRRTAHASDHAIILSAGRAVCGARGRPMCPLSATR